MKIESPNPTERKKDALVNETKKINKNKRKKPLCLKRIEKEGNFEAPIQVQRVMRFSIWVCSLLEEASNKLFILEKVKYISTGNFSFPKKNGAEIKGN